MYEQSPSTSYQDILQQVKKMSKDKKIKIINEFTKIRTNRRHRHQELLKISTIHLIYVIILECSGIFIDIEHLHLKDSY